MPFISLVDKQNEKWTLAINNREGKNWARGEKKEATDRSHFSIINI